MIPLVDYEEVSREGDSIALSIIDSGGNILYVHKNGYTYGVDVMHFKWHRKGGPAVIYGDGSLNWYVNNRPHGDVQKYCEACGFSVEETLIWVLKYGDMLPANMCQL